MVQLVQTPLWEHQVATVKRFEKQPQVLCAWEMGTGKTLFGIERDLTLRSTGEVQQTLVVAPLATHSSWLKAWKAEAPNLTVKKINPKKREWFYDPKVDVHIMHYEALRLMPELAKTFQHGIFDECHRLKNRTAKQTKSAKKLKIPFLTDMSGSPVTDRPHDLWSILNHLHPDEYSSFWRFFHTFVDAYRSDEGYWITRGPNERWINDGIDLISLYYSRILAKDCLDLPEVLYSKVEIDLPTSQRKAYDEMNRDMITWLNNQEGELSPMTAQIMIAKLQRLQQLAMATIEVAKDDSYKMVLPSAKLQAAMQIISDNDTEPFLVFSQFKQPLELFAHMLSTRAKNKGGPISNVLFTGDVDHFQRERNLTKFIDGETRVFLATFGAGGEGVDGLQSVCRSAIFLDRDWSPMRNDQAEKRLHRGGQEQPVHIIDIIANKTVDIERFRKIQLKKKWVLQTLGDIS